MANVSNHGPLAADDLPHILVIVPAHLVLHCIGDRINGCIEHLGRCHLNIDIFELTLDDGRLQVDSEPALNDCPQCLNGIELWTVSRHKFHFEILVQNGQHQVAKVSACVV